MSVQLGIPSLPPKRGAVAAGRPDVPGLVDTFGRVATDLRISLTDKCNLRCTYCMPEEGLPFLPQQSLLQRDEIQRLVRLAVTEFGVRDVRFTGGEPLLRKDLADIIADCAALEPRPEISLTTNAIGLTGRAEKLAEAGLDRLNISLDSVVSETFTRISRRPLLHRVLEGIEAAGDAGIGPIKINAVVMRGVNDHEAAGLLAWCLDRGYQLRFIEQMPLDADHSWDRARMVTAGDVRELLEQRFSLAPDPDPRDGAPAELHRVFAQDGELLGKVGIIASVTEPFCADCRRTRLTAEGRVRSCLFAHEETDLLAPLREGASDAEIIRLWQNAMWAKQAGHGMNTGTFEQPARTMSAIGG